MDLQRESRKVGIVYDERMCRHARPLGKSHPEEPRRIKVIWDKLCSAGLVQRCVMVNAKEASDDELSTVHSQKHIKLIKSISSKSDKTRDTLASSFNSIYFNQGSSSAALLAAGSVLHDGQSLRVKNNRSQISLVAIQWTCCDDLMVNIDNKKPDFLIASSDKKIRIEKTSFESRISKIIYLHVK